VTGDRTYKSRAPSQTANLQKIDAQPRMIVDLCAVYSDLSGFREAFFGRISGIHHLPDILAARRTRTAADRSF
jgi:hypothetical protein